MQASEEEIKCAWKRKAFKLHPDRQNGDPEATKQFQSVANAYEVLRDRTLRAEYDKELLHRLYLEVRSQSLHVVLADNRILSFGSIC